MGKSIGKCACNRDNETVTADPQRNDARGAETIPAQLRRAGSASGASTQAQSCLSTGCTPHTYRTPDGIPMTLPDA